MERVKKTVGTLGSLLIAAVFAYCFLAAIVFEFRHPWATEQECLNNIDKVLTFQKVPYQVMRPRE